MKEIDLMDRYPQTQRPLDERSQASGEDRRLSKMFGKEYFDGTRQQGYGGYRYDGRWKPVVDRFRGYYGLASTSAILDIGCAKGFMLHDFQDLLPGVTVAGIDISAYALSPGLESVKPFIVQADAKDLPFPDKSFDLVISIATLHNLDGDELRRSFREVERVSRKHKFIKLAGYRTEEEKTRFEKWNVVAKTYMHCNEWVKYFNDVGYTGDYTWFFA